MNDLNYYLIYGTGVPNVPAVILDSDQNEYDFSDLEEAYEGTKLIKLRFMEPYPKKPIMVDYHDDGAIGVFSRKIVEALTQFNFKEVQFLPCEVEDPRNNNIYDNYYYSHIFNIIECFDYKNSVYSGDENLGFLGIVNKFCLDYKKLEDIPLNERLIFRLEEMYAYQLFHESVVEAIMATNPEGIRFVKVEDYHTGSAFD